VKKPIAATLDGGTFNALEQDSFAGEGIMDLLHPGERRLLSHATDDAHSTVREPPLRASPFSKAL
jgi:hypothetical protein